MSDFSREQFLGCLASRGMSRAVKSFTSSFYIQTGGPVGYGIYLTDRRLIGISYKKTVLGAYRPAFILFLIWIGSLVALFVYARLTGAQELPPLPFVMALAVVDLVLLVYWSPRQASKRMEREGTMTSIEQLQNVAPDIVLNRADISQVDVRPAKILVTLTSGISHTFLHQLPQRRIDQLLNLFGQFCSLSPLIEMTISDVSGKTVRKVVGLSSKEEKRSVKT